MLENFLTLILVTGAILVITGGARAAREIHTISDYFTFGSSNTDAGLRRAFTVTNSTFTTSFVALFLLASSTGAASLAIPVGFVLGIVFYIFIILPKMMPLFASNQRYPELLESATGKKWIRSLCASFMLLNLLIFTFAELQGLQLFLREFYPKDSAIRAWLPIALVIIMAWHVAKAGYRAVIGNDKIQFFLILAGGICLIVSLFIAFRSTTTAEIAAATTKTRVSLGEFSTILFVADALSGFLFAQMIYYDNWQRLAFFVSGRIGKVERTFRAIELERLKQVIQREYLIGALFLGLIYTIPIVLAFALLGSNETSPATISTLADFFKRVWQSEDIYGIPIGPILFIGSVLFMLAALISTAEVYIVGAVNIFIEDILRVKIDGTDRSTSALDRTRFSAAVSCFLLIPFLFIEPNFEKLFTFMFYSANGLVGPVTLLLLGKKVSSVAFVFSLVFAMGYCLPPLIDQTISWAFPLPGVVVVSVSLLTSFALSFSRKKT
ncbi:MAG: hypothetical protein J0M09_05660 [Xanthomonadales bacterium]|nr:hypothetical protein [Xanthomonadales bacterium]